MFRAERGHRGEVRHPHLIDVGLHSWPRPHGTSGAGLGEEFGSPACYPQAFPTNTLATVEFMVNIRLCA